MDLGMLSLIRLVLCCIDVYMLYIFLDSMFEQRAETLKKIISFCVVVMSILLINTLGSSWINLLTIPFFLSVYSILAFKISLANSIVYTIIYYVSFAAGKEVAFELLRHLLAEVSSSYIPHWFTSGGIYYLIFEYILGFLYLIFITRFTSKLNVDVSNHFCWYLLVLPLSSLLIMGGYLYMDFPQSKILQICIVVGTFLLYFTNSIIFIILKKFEEMMEQAKNTELNEMKQKMDVNHFVSIMKINSVYREYIHEVRKYFNSFRVLAKEQDTQRIIDIIDDLEGSMQERGSETVYNNNAVLNGMLNELTEKAKKYEVKTTFFIEECLNVDFINDGDLISMFGNLFDNSMEAVIKCPPGKRNLDVKLYMGTDYFLVLQMTNSYAESIRRIDKRLLTTKKSIQHHGLGIRIVTTLAEKYGGALELKEKDSEFLTLLMISNYGQF